MGRKGGPYLLASYRTSRPSPAILGLGQVAFVLIPINVTDRDSNLLAHWATDV